MRRRIVPWEDVKPVIRPETESYGLCEIFKSRSDFAKAYPYEIPVELEGDK